MTDDVKAQAVEALAGLVVDDMIERLRRLANEDVIGGIGWWNAFDADPNDLLREAADRLELLEARPDRDALWGRDGILGEDTDRDGWMMWCGMPRAPDEPWRPRGTWDGDTFTYAPDWQEGDIGHLCSECIWIDPTTEENTDG